MDLAEIGDLKRSEVGLQIRAFRHRSVIPEEIEQVPRVQAHFAKEAPEKMISPFEVREEAEKRPPAPVEGPLFELLPQKLPECVFKCPVPLEGVDHLEIGIASRLDGVLSEQGEAEGVEGGCVQPPEMLVHPRKSLEEQLSGCGELRRQREVTGVIGQDVGDA